MRLFGQLNVIKRGAFRQEITPKPLLALEMWLSHENLSAFYCAKLMTNVSIKFVFVFSNSLGKSFFLKNH